MPTPKAVNIDELNEQLGAYVRTNYPSILQTLLIEGFSFLSTQGGYAKLINGVTDEIVLTQLYFASLLQPGNKDTFDPKGPAATAKPRIGKVRACKVDLSFSPTQIAALWKSHLGNISGASRTTPYDIPFEQELVAGIIKTLKADIRTQALFGGVHNAAGTSAVDTMNGYLKLLSTCITDGDVPAGNIFAGAPITRANAIDQFEGVADLVPSQFNSLDFVILADPKSVRDYRRDYRDTHGSLNYNGSFEKITLDGAPNMELVPEIGLSGSDRIIITPKDNLFWLTNTFGSVDSITVEKEKRNVHWMMDFECAPEIAMPSHIWTNDQV